jgi:transcriptional regulator with XRE-family HTH domain
MDEQKRFSAMLRAKRYENKLSQEKAAEILGVSTRWYNDLENGKGEPGFKTICKISKAYGINFADFAEDEENII